MKFFSVTLLVFICHLSAAQQRQISINRVEQMPNEPAPYLMRDWKEVTQQYDNLVFDPTLTGTHLPLISLKPAGVNYPALQPIQLDTYVGTTSETQAEAINIIPAIVGSSLVGIDKANQNGVNWVEKIKDFYNSGNGQNVYLNGTNSTSGSDWWYDVMPNVFFYQAYSLYPGIPDFDMQFVTVADRWLSAVYAMDGKATPWTIPNMNYRGWYLSSMTGNANGVKEPEAAGSIGWLLFQAYRVTGEKKYLEGAQLCLDYLNGLTSNPSYELQLPYGTLTAATLNATQGSDYDIENMLNWSFNRGQLRGWGTIVGKWDGVDVSGLVGEANDAGNDYAFMLNGYQQAAALAPVAKYDKRFARALSKWILNLSNASRLYYPTSLSADKQDDYTWSIQYDPESSIGYEALKENWEGKALYGTGDAKRNGWAATNLALYGSSSVGYLAAIVEPTNVEKILKLDLNKTDFFADNAFPVFLLFNPHAANQQVTLNEGSGPFDIYDAISETVIATGVSGDFSIDINPNEAVLLTILPSGTQFTPMGRKLMAGDYVVDYHYGYDFSPDFRIKAIAAEETVEFNDVENVYVTIENPPSTVSYKWFVNEVFTSETESGTFAWTAPAMVGNNEIRVEAISNGIVVKDSLNISVVAIVPDAPVVIQMSADKDYYLSDSQAKIITLVEDADKEKFTYEYTVPAGNFEQTDSLITWTVPGEGLYTVRCIVRNIFDLTTEAALDVLVKVPSSGTTDPLAYYPLNNNVEDYSGHDFHGNVEGTQQADDALGMNDFAYRFSNSTDIIFVNNSSALNFTEAITVSFWMSPGSVGHEAFLLSHGSWEQRWKISITPEKKLRWTVKTEAGVKDLDSREPVSVNTFVHVTALYTGYSIELYLDGQLDNVTGHNGSILTTSKQITFGQKDYSDRLYYYNGILDEVRLYDTALQPDEIALLKELWADEEPTAVSPELIELIQVYPNPVSNGMLKVLSPRDKIVDLRLFAPDGREVLIEWSDRHRENSILLKGGTKGLFFLKVVTTKGDAWVKVLIN
jgi:hypothetical protein